MDSINNSGIDNKKCGFCGEVIRADSRRCPYCGSLLEIKVEEFKYEQETVEPSSVLDGTAEILSDEKSDIETVSGDSELKEVTATGNGTGAYDTIRNDSLKPAPSLSSNSNRFNGTKMTVQGDKPLANGMKVFITALSTIIPVLGQLIGIIISIVFMNTEDDPDRKSFGVALLISSLVVFVLSCISSLILLMALGATRT